MFDYIIFSLVAFTWECEVGESCSPFLSVKRVDMILPEKPTDDNQIA
jgi:hypothetical protein